MPLQQDYTQRNLPEGAKARLGKGVITDIQLSPDNTRLAIASSIGVWLYDVSTRAQTTPLVRYNKHTVSQMAFSPDSKMLAISTHDKTLQLWNASTGENLLTFRTSGGPFTFLKFSDDSKTLVSQNWNGTVWFWNITTGAQLNTLSPKLPRFRLGRDRVWSFATDVFVTSTGSTTFAVGNKDGTISIQDGPTGREIQKLIVQANDNSSLPIQSPKPYTYKREIVDGKPATKWVNSLNFSPDGKTLVNWISYQVAYWGGSSSGRAGPAELWDVETGEQLSILPYGINVAFLGDGETLAIIKSGECTIWDIATRRKIAEFPQAPNVRFSGDGETLAIIENNGYTLWDIATRSEIAVHSPVIEWFEVFPERFLLSQDGTILVTADENGTVALWETKNIKQLRALITGYAAPFMGLAFTYNGKTLASSDSTGKIQLWDIHTRTKQRTIKAANDRISGVALATDNVTLTTVNEQDTSQWHITTGQQVTDYIVPNIHLPRSSMGFDDGTGFEIKGFAFTPRAEKLVINDSKRSTTEVWDLTIGRSPRRLTTIAGRWGPLALTPDGNTLATQSDSRNAADLWNTHTGERIATFKASKNWIDELSAWFNYHRVYALAFAHDGKTLAVGTRNKHIQLWNVPDHQRVGSLEGHKYVVCELAFSPDGKTLASGDTGGKIHLWEMPTHQHLTTFDGHKGYVRTLAFAHDGKTLASIGGDDGTILLWNVPSK